jgi:hypothetical protein
MRKIFLLFLVGVTAGHAGTAPRSHEVQLSSRDRAELSRVACAQRSLPEADQINASKERKTSTLIQVAVRCGSHRAEGAVPVAQVAACTNAGAKWSCESGREALTVGLADKQLLTVVPEGMSTALAASVITEAIKLTFPPFYKPLAPLLMSECSMREAGQGPFKGATLFRLTCTHWDVEITRDCGTRPCRHFVARTDPRPTL